MDPFKEAWGSEVSEGLGLTYSLHCSSFFWLTKWELGVPYLGVLIIRILLFRVLY